MSDDAAGQEETELDRFRDLAGKLIQVPKGEIDAERAKEKERKEKERGNRGREGGQARPRLWGVKPTLPNGPLPLSSPSR